MATANDTRGRNLPSSPEPVSKISSVQIPSEPIQRHMESLLLALRDIEATVIIAAGALRDEDAFAGVCAARVLRTQVANRLSHEIDSTAKLFAIHLKTDREYEA